MVNASANTQPCVIGTVKGPGENGNQYLFITADNRQVKIGEFVYYQVPAPSSTAASQTSTPLTNTQSTDTQHSSGSEAMLQILGKISDRRLSDHLPDRIFADTEISP
ncbi:MAG: hypothetical protein AAF050_14390, partial [Cyanobacteria bacterium J06649_5]